MSYRGMKILSRKIGESGGRAPEVGVLKGSVSRPRSISTYVMGGGMIVVVLGLFFDFLLLLPGAILFGAGLLIAFIEVLLEA